MINFYPKTNRQIYWDIVKFEYRYNMWGYIFAVVLLTLMSFLIITASAGAGMFVLFGILIFVFPLLLFIIRPIRFFQKWKKGEESFSQWYFDTYEQIERPF